MRPGASIAAVFLAGGVALAGGLAVSVLELATVRPAVDTTGVYGPFAAVGVDPGLSVPSKLTHLSQCYTAMTSLAARVQPTPVRNAVAQRCLAVASDIVSRSPPFSAAWLVRAEAAAQLGDMDTFREALRQAFRTGRNERWLAEQRIVLADARYEALDADLRAAHESDIRLLLATHLGREGLAPAYRALAGLRGRVDAMLVDMRASDRRSLDEALDRLDGAGNQQ